MTNDSNTFHIMLHSAMGDSIVAFRHVIKFADEHKDAKINLIYNKNIDPFMADWIWPENITLMPLEQTVHDFDNLHAFPYHCDDESIVKAFNESHPEAIDYRPYKVVQEPIENNLKDFIPDRPPFIFGLNQYIVLQPISTVHQDYSRRWIEEELQTYEKFLINLIEHVHMYTPLSIVTVGTHDDAEKFPHLNAMASNARYFNLMGHLSINDFCDTIKYSSGLLGFNSSGVNIANYIFDKPVVSWRLKPCFVHNEKEIWEDFFDKFLNPKNACSLARPWEKEMSFYSDFLKEHVLDEKQQNINS